MNGEGQSTRGNLLARQLWGVFRLDIRRALLSARSFAVYFLAFAPLVLVAIWAFTPFPTEEFEGPQEAALVFSVLFELYVRVSIFFSTLRVVFITGLFREVFICWSFLAEHRLFSSPTIASLFPRSTSADNSVLPMDLASSEREDLLSRMACRECAQMFSAPSGGNRKMITSIKARKF